MKEINWNPEFGTGGILHCECDLCGKSVDFKFKAKPSYKRASSSLKEKGWVFRMVSGKWYDFCSEKCFEIFEGEE